MGFFDSFNKKNKKSIYDSKLRKAEEIVNRLGEEKWGRTFLGSRTGRRCTDQVYKGYNLEIVKEEQGYTYEKDVYVNYKGKRVLDYEKYVSGPWEEVFNELYNSIDSILDDRINKERLVKKKESIHFAILDITGEGGRVDIGDGIIVGSSAWYGGGYDQIYEGSSSTVYKNGKLVFEKSMMFNDRHSGDPYITYVPGSWEEKVKEYAVYAKKTREKSKQQTLYDEAMEEVKRLRKLRGEN